MYTLRSLQTCVYSSAPSLHPLWSVRAALGRTGGVEPLISGVYTRTPALCEQCEIFSFRAPMSSHILPARNYLSPAAFLGGAKVGKWQTWGSVDKESDVKNPEVNTPPPSLSIRKGLLPVELRLMWASSICGCVMVWKNNCAAPYKEAVCTFITLLMLLWQGAVLGWEVNASYPLFIVPSEEEKCLTDLMSKVTDVSAPALCFDSFYTLQWK